jgi:hypothetical protein
MVDKFDAMLQENCVYHFSGGAIKASAPKYATVSHEFCVVFEKNTDIQQIDDDGSVAGNV